MAWVKYGENDLINLDKTTDIRIEKVQDKKGDYVYDIRFYTGVDYLFKRYTSLEFDEGLKGRYYVSAKKLSRKI